MHSLRSFNFVKFSFLPLGVLLLFRFLILFGFVLVLSGIGSEQELAVDLDGEMDYSRIMERLEIKLIALIHTHPGNTTSFLSSTDMHHIQN